MTDPKISYSITQKEGFYAHLWLKRVNGFNPAYHCVRSLRGSYAPGFPGPSSREPNVGYSDSEDATKFDFLYLCGVHISYELDMNLHAPMRYAPGQTVHIENDGLIASFIDAELLLVPELPATFDLTTDEAYTRCRNYQFAYNAYTQPGVIVLASDPDNHLSNWAAEPAQGSFFEDDE